MQYPSGALREVSGCTCTGLTCFVVIVPVVAVKGVVVVKEVASWAIFCTVLYCVEQYETFSNQFALYLNVTCPDTVSDVNLAGSGRHLMMYPQMY